MPIVPSNRVFPSGSEIATLRAPILPPIPVLFSVTNGCPYLIESQFPIVRASTSAVPPGVKGATIVVGPCGTFAAKARAAGKQLANNSRAVRREIDMMDPLFLVWARKDLVRAHKESKDPCNI